MPFARKRKNNGVLARKRHGTYGNDVLVEVFADVDGDYGVDINGTVYTVSVANRIGNKSISLNTGHYYANITPVNKNFIIKSTIDIILRYENLY